MVSASSRRLRGMLLLALLIVSGPVAASVSAASTGPEDAVAPALTDPPPTWPRPDAVAGEGWILVEAATGQVLAAHAADERRPVASTVKILTLLTASMRTSLSTEIVVGDEVTGIEGATVGLAPGDLWTVEQLLDAVIARSGNDAVEALAVHVAGSQAAFVDLMREDARRLGLDGVVLTSPTGLDDGNLLSARDLATVARAALADPDLRPLFARRVVELPGLGVVASRNLLLDTYPGATGLKTGFTAAAGTTLVASGSRGGRELVVVVLDAGDDPARFDAATQLLDLGFDRFNRTEVTGRMTIARAGGGMTVAVEPVLVTTPTDQPPTVGFTVPGAVDALLGSVPLLAGGHALGQLPTTVVEEPVAPDGPAIDVARAVVDHGYTALRAATATPLLR